MSSESDFDRLVHDLLTEPGVETGTGFGKTAGLRVDGKIFVMLMGDGLVLKLPAERCAELRSTGWAESLRIGKREMREWVTVPGDGPYDWKQLADEALSFVRATASAR